MLPSELKRSLPPFSRLRHTAERSLLLLLCYCVMAAVPRFTLNFISLVVRHGKCGVKASLENAQFLHVCSDWSYNEITLLPFPIKTSSGGNECCRTDDMHSILNNFLHSYANEFLRRINSKCRKVKG